MEILIVSTLANCVNLFHFLFTIAICGDPSARYNGDSRGTDGIHMKSTILASGLLALLAGQAFADCPTTIRELDGALNAAEIAPDVKAQLQDMRQQAEKLCSSGNDDEAADVIAEAQALLAAEAR